MIVHVFEGATEVASASSTAAGAKWSTSTLSKALASGKHTFTAYATEKSAAGNADGKSATVTFEVNTEPPAVSIGGAAVTVEDTTPAFSGTASENTEVVVHVFKEGPKWRLGEHDGLRREMGHQHPEQSALAGKHSFTAVATEKSGLGNAEGTAHSDFEVNTEAPVVTIASPKTPWNVDDAGVLGDRERKHRSRRPRPRRAPEVATASDDGLGGKWSTSTARQSVASRKTQFTAPATEKSGLGNAEGKSGTIPGFEVNTESPVVTIIGPKTPSNVTTAGILGRGERKHRSRRACARRIDGSRTASTTAAEGKWATSTLSTALPTGKHIFKAYATEKSAVGNADGRSSEVSFVVNTLPPTVTLGGPAEVSSNRNPSLIRHSERHDAREGQAVQGHKNRRHSLRRRFEATVSEGHFSTKVVSPL